MRYSVFVVGCGGIGGFVLDLLPQVMACINLDLLPDTTASTILNNADAAESISSRNMFASLHLIDGDVFSGHNTLRQEAHRGSKLVVQMNKIRRKDAFTTWLNDTRLVGHECYVTPENSDKIFSVEFDCIPIVFLCVDNHKTRYEISKYFVERKDKCLLINGGNNKTSGNVTIFSRDRWQIYDPPIYDIYKDVTANADRRPDEVDCGTVTRENDQTAITNCMIANIMLAMFRKGVTEGFIDGFYQKTRQKDEYGENKKVRKNEVIVDFNTFSMMSLSNKIVTNTKKEDSIIEGNESDIDQDKLQ